MAAGEDVCDGRKYTTSSDQFIHSNNWCGKCMYNIPRGTLLLLLPAAAMLLIGMSALIDDGVRHWREGLFHIGIIFAAIGGVLSIVVVYFCAKSWYRRRHMFPWNVAKYESHERLIVRVMMEDDGRQEHVPPDDTMITQL